MATDHDPSFAADRERFFAQLNEMAVGYDLIKRLLKKAGLPKPSSADHAYRERLLLALKAGKRGADLVAEMQRPFGEGIWGSRLADTGPECRVAA